MLSLEEIYGVMELQYLDFFFFNSTDIFIYFSVVSVRVLDRVRMFRARSENNTEVVAVLVLLYYY